ELELLPPLDRLLHEDLGDRTRRKTAHRDLFEALVVPCDPRSATPEHERWPDDHRIPECLRDRDRLLERVREPAAGQRQTGLRHRLRELLTILGPPDRLKPRPGQPNPVRVERPRLG